MKFSDYLELSDFEKRQFIDIIRTNLKFVEDKFNFDKSILDINRYIEERKAQRERQSKTSGIKWPEELSKKEMILCKINMINNMLNSAPYSLEEDQEAAQITRKACQVFIQSIITGIFEETKRINIENSSLAPCDKNRKRFEGLHPESSPVLNEIYDITYKYYQRLLK